MARISIGKTRSKKDIFVDASNWEIVQPIDVFQEFSTQEAFDALLAIQSLLAKELRRNPVDKSWCESLDTAESYLMTMLGKRVIAAFKKSLGITSAFEARDYGLALLHRHFRI